LNEDVHVKRTCGTKGKPKKEKEEKKISEKRRERKEDKRETKEKMALRGSPRVGGVRHYEQPLLPGNTTTGTMDKYARQQTT
jgi:hypothetical protein